MGVDTQDVLVVHAIALDSPDLIGQYLPAFVVGLEAKVLGIRVEQVFQYDARVARIRTFNHGAVAPEDEFPQVLADGLSNLEAQSADRQWVPKLEQDSFRPVGEPWKFGIGVLNRQKNVLDRDQRPFFGSPDTQRQLAAVLFQQSHPARSVEHT